MLHFPFATLRSGQAELLEEIDGAFASGLALLCSAPTGLGKTAAALYPAAKHALAHGRRTFFVTAKRSQQALALDTLRAILRDEPSLLALQIQAKERSCPLDGRVCREDRCRYQNAFASRLEDSGILDTLALERVVAGDRVAELALRHALCPFETSLKLAERAHLVVCDYNYVFDPRVYLRRFFDFGYEADLVIVDEAHNLPERARDYYSPVLECAALERALVEARARTTQGARRAAALLDYVLAHVRETWRTLHIERVGSTPLALYAEPPDADFVARLQLQSEEALSTLAPPWRSAARLLDAGVRPLDPVRAALYALRDFASCAALDPDKLVALWEEERARILCLDASSFLRSRLRGFHAAVCMSATLAPFEWSERELGLEGPRTERVELRSPFPRENRLLIAVPSVETRYRERSAHAEPIARLIASVIALRPGNYLAFFPSFSYQAEVVAKLPPTDARVFLQTQAMPTESLLLMLKRRSTPTQLVCGVQGGVLAEGVDYPGEMAIGVFVVGPGLPAPSPERELYRAYYERELSAGFEFAFLYPGLRRSVQAGGRAIRSAEDRAFVMLLGRRFTERAYLEKLPQDWREDLVIAPDPLASVRSFWATANC